MKRIIGILSIFFFSNNLNPPSCLVELDNSSLPTDITLTTKENGGRKDEKDIDRCISIVSIIITLVIGIPSIIIAYLAWKKPTNSGLLEHGSDDIISQSRDVLEDLKECGTSLKEILDKYICEQHTAQKLKGDVVGGPNDLTLKELKDKAYLTDIDNIREKITQLDELVSNGYYLDAISLGNKILSHFSYGVISLIDFSKVNFHLGYCYFEIGNYLKSVETYQKIVTLIPQEDRAWFNLGCAHDELGNSYLAQEAYSTSLKLNPNNLLAKTNLGTLYGTLKEYDKSLSILNEVVKEEPKNDYALMNIGIIYYETAQYDNSIAIINKAVLYNPNNEKAWNTLGNSFSAKGEYKKAINAYYKAIQISPRSSYIWQNLGSCYLNERMFNEAECAYVQAMEIQPNDNILYIKLADTHFLNENYKCAIHEYEKAIELGNNDFTTFAKVGFSYKKIDEIEKSIKAYEKALEINPETAKLWSELRALYYNNGEYEKAIIAYQHEDNSNVKTYFFWFGIGVSYYQKQEFSRAIECLVKSIEYNKEYERTYIMLISTLFLTNSQMQIKNWLENYRTIFKEETKAYRILSFLYQSIFEHWGRSVDDTFFYIEEALVDDYPFDYNFIKSWFDEENLSSYLNQSQKDFILAVISNLYS